MCCKTVPAAVGILGLEQKCSGGQLTRDLEWPHQCKLHQSCQCSCCSCRVYLDILLKTRLPSLMLQHLSSATGRQLPWGLVGLVLKVHLEVQHLKKYEIINIFLFRFVRFLMQLSDVLLSNNKLGGTLPETWSKLTSVSPIVELTCLCKSLKHVLPCHIVLCKSVPQKTPTRAFAAWLLFKRPPGCRQQWLSSTVCQQGPLKYLSLITRPVAEPTLISGLACQRVPALLCIDTPSGYTQSMLYLILRHV